MTLLLYTLMSGLYVLHKQYSMAYFYHSDVFVLANLILLSKLQTESNLSSNTKHRLSSGDGQNSFIRAKPVLKRL